MTARISRGLTVQVYEGCHILLGGKLRRIATVQGGSSKIIHLLEFLAENKAIFSPKNDSNGSSNEPVVNVLEKGAGLVLSKSDSNGEENDSKSIDSKCISGILPPLFLLEDDNFPH